MHPDLVERKLKLYFWLRTLLSVRVCNINIFIKAFGVTFAKLSHSSIGWVSWVEINLKFCPPTHLLIFLNNMWSTRHCACSVKVTLVRVVVVLLLMAGKKLNHRHLDLQNYIQEGNYVQKMALFIVVCEVLKDFTF